MAKRGCREFHIRDENLMQLLMADNSDGEDHSDDHKQIIVMEKITFN